MTTHTTNFSAAGYIAHRHASGRGGRAAIGISSTALTAQRWHHYEVW